MGKKTEQWRRERAAMQEAPDLLSLRPAGLQAVAPPRPNANDGLQIENDSFTGSALHQGEPNLRQPRKRTGKVTTREPAPRVPNDQLLGLGNYSPVAHVQAARERFLQLYAERGTMVECCRLAGLSYNAVQHALDKDADFAAAFKEAEQQVLEKLEREAMRRAVEGTVIRSRKFWHGEMVGEDIRTEYSDNLLMMLLRAKNPTAYRDNSLITINQVIKAVEGFDPAEVLGLPGGSAS